MMERSAIHVFFAFCILCSTAAGCLHTGSDIKQSPDLEPPVIKHAQSGKIIDDRYVATSSFLVGDRVNFVISIKGSPKHITKVHLEEYYPENVNQDHMEFKPIDAVPRSTKSKSVTLKEPIEFIGPPGERKFVIQVEDKDNNLSNAIDLYLIIH